MKKSETRARTTN